MSCDFLCGWVGGCSGLVLGHPLDTLKVRQQSLGTKSVLATVREAHTSGLYSTLRRGLAFPLISAGAINSVFFGVYGLGLNSLTVTGEKPGYSQVFMAGCLGGAGQLVLACPVDLVKVRLQSHQGLAPLPSSPTGVTTSLARRLGMGAPYNCLHTVYSQGGVRGCYRGLVPQAFRDVKASGLYFLIYQYTMDTISSHLSSPSTLLHSFWAGGLAGVLSWQVSTTISVIVDIIPFTILIVFNCLIIWTIKRKTILLPRSAKRERRDLFIAGILILIIIVFAVCHSLSVIVNFVELITVLTESGGSEGAWGPELTICVSMSHLLITINCSSNFAIYCVKDPKFRRYFLSYLSMGLWGSTAPHLSPTPQNVVSLQSIASRTHKVQEGVNMAKDQENLAMELWQPHMHGGMQATVV